MSNSEIEQSGTVKGHIPNGASLSGRISNVVSLSGHISIGSGSSDFIIKMTVEVNGDNYTVTSCDKTMEQIDAAVASGQNIKAIAFDKFIMPMTQIMEYGESYTFGAFLGAFLVMADVAKNTESGTDDWQFYLIPLAADIVEYSNAAMPRISTVGGALDELVLDSHTHANKSVLDKFAESDGKPTYNGEAIGGGASDFIIKMTVEGDDDGNYTVISCDATIEQIDAAVSAEKRVVVIATDTARGMFWELPIVQALQGVTYIFIAFARGRYVLSTVYKSGENEIWEFIENGISSENIDYYNSTQPDVETVMAALNKLFTKSHTHANKDTLDKLSDSNGKLQYNGSDVGLKGDKGDKGDPGSDANVTKANVITALGYTPEAVSAQVSTGSNIALADNTEYRLADVTTLTLTYPTGNFECWMRLTFAASGDITVTLPTGTRYIGTAPDFKNGETWEMSIKDGVVIAQKVGEGA